MAAAVILKCSTSRHMLHMQLPGTLQLVKLLCVVRPCLWQNALKHLAQLCLHLVTTLNFFSHTLHRVWSSQYLSLLGEFALLPTPPVLTGDCAIGDRPPAGGDDVVTAGGTATGLIADLDPLPSFPRLIRRSDVPNPFVRVGVAMLVGVLVFPSFRESLIVGENLSLELTRSPSPLASIPTALRSSMCFEKLLSLRRPSPFLLPRALPARFRAP